MEKSLFEQMGGTYTQQGDYLLPDLVTPTEDKREIGVWGQRRLRYLKRITGFCTIICSHLESCTLTLPIPRNRHKNFSLGW